jgi:uncharacterized membrane protein
MHQVRRLSLNPKGATVSESNPSGLSDNAASAIAYITFVPAIVFLVMPPYNASPNVRFHSWQSIFLNIAAIVVCIALSIVFAVAWAILPFGFYAIGHLIWLLIDLAWFIIWLVCILKAINGVRFKLPIIGALAEKQAGV